MPELKKGEVDLWKQMQEKVTFSTGFMPIMTVQGDESVDIEKMEKDEKSLDVEFAIVPSEVIVSDDETSDESEMDEDERRIFDLINLKVKLVVVTS